MSAEPAGLETTTFTVAVDGGELQVICFGAGPTPVLGIHGITANSMSLRPVARRLGAEHTLLAPDLRGRGGSAALPGPYGMRAHAADCAAVIRASTSGPVVVLGESMGAYVAVVLAAEHPAVVQRLVLADGGLPLPLPPGLPPGTEPAAVIDMLLGPAIARLGLIFESHASYLDFWRRHPAFERDWSDDIQAYFEYDLAPCPGGFRSRVSEAAVRVDAVQHLAEPQVIGEALTRIACPITLVRAPRNLLDQPVPLLGDAVVDEWQGRLPHLSTEMVEDVNHYTLMMGWRGAGLLAARVAG